MPTNYIKCCDNVEGLRCLPDDCVDLTVTSPPYDDQRKYIGFECSAEYCEIAQRRIADALAEADDWMN